MNTRDEVLKSFIEELKLQGIEEWIPAEPPFSKKTNPEYAIAIHSFMAGWNSSVDTIVTSLRELENSATEQTRAIWRNHGMDNHGDYADWIEKEYNIFKKTESKK